jgi:hypothetical protein
VVTGAPPDLPPRAADDEELTRFLTQSNHYTSTRVSARAFSLPRGATTISVFRTEGLDDSARWLLGDERIQHTLTRRVLGAALFTPTTVASAGLRLDRDGVGHHRHASLCDWPTGKDAQKECATVLAVAATLRLRATSP